MNLIKKYIAAFFVLVTLYAASADTTAGLVELDEVWVYLMRGEESFFNPDAQPISDLCYFSAEINAYGELISVPSFAKLAGYGGRKHLVVAELSSMALTHFCLDSAFGIRDRLIADIANAARPFDGVQIDFEAIPLRDRGNFIEFLCELKKAIGKKILSVALPARVSDKADVLGYEKIAAIVDKIIIMAYDEHWSGSKPGPVASLQWCARVADYVTKKIPPQKLVMGLPFYGRAWGNKSTSRAYKHSGVVSIIAQKEIAEIRRDDTGLPRFSYEETVLVEVHYDDAESTEKRLRLYTDAGVRSSAFWRLGQEDPEVWSRIRLK